MADHLPYPQSAEAVSGRTAPANRLANRRTSSKSGNWFKWSEFTASLHLDVLYHVKGSGFTSPGAAKLPRKSISSRQTPSPQSLIQWFDNRGQLHGKQILGQIE